MLTDGASLALSMLNVFSANKYGDFNDPACPLYGQYEANLKQAKRNSYLPKFGRYNMAQSQLDVVAVKGFTVNLMICSGGTAKFKTMLVSDPSLMSIIISV